MPIINISEKDFQACFNAAHAAKDAGDTETAVAMDKIARKMNAALANNHPSMKITGCRDKLSWTDVPSVFENQL